MFFPGEPLRTGKLRPVVCPSACLNAWRTRLVRTIGAVIVSDDPRAAPSVNKVSVPQKSDALRGEHMPERAPSSGAACVPWRVSVARGHTQRHVRGSSRGRCVRPGPDLLLACRRAASGHEKTAPGRRAGRRFSWGTQKDESPNPLQMASTGTRALHIGHSAAV